MLTNKRRYLIGVIIQTERDTCTAVAKANVLYGTLFTLGPILMMHMNLLKSFVLIDTCLNTADRPGITWNILGKTCTGENMPVCGNDITMLTKITAVLLIGLPGVDKP